MEIKYGNKFVLDFPCKDADGNAISNLSSAEEIYFQIKETAEAEDTFISLTKSDGAITINTPATGTVRITGNADDWCDRDEIDFVNGEFTAFWGLEIKFSDEDVREINITEYTIVIDTVTILEDVVQN